MIITNTDYSFEKDNIISNENEIENIFLQNSYALEEDTDEDDKNSGNENVISKKKDDTIFNIVAAEEIGIVLGKQKIQ